MCLFVYDEEEEEEEKNEEGNGVLNSFAYATTQ